MSGPQVREPGVVPAGVDQTPALPIKEKGRPIMAMGRKGTDEAKRKFANHMTYSNSTGSLHAHSGSARNMGWLVSATEAGNLKASARRATYTVYSYDTPIGWAIEDEDTGLFERVIPDERHSTTTSHHQGLLRVAWGDSYHNGTREGRARWQDESRRNTDVIRADLPGEGLSAEAEQRDWDRVHADHDRYYPAHP